MNHQGLWTSVLGLLLGGAVVLGTPQQPWPDAAALQAMTARFAPVDIGADISALPAGERRALAKLVQAGRIMDALFLRQVWGGNEAVLFDLLADATPAGQARLHAFLVNKGPWSRARPQRAVRRRRAGEARGRQLLPGRRREGRRRGLAADAAGGGTRAGHGFLHYDSPRPRRAVPDRAVQRRVPGRTGARGRVAARGGRPHGRARR